MCEDLHQYWQKLSANFSVFGLSDEIFASSAHMPRGQTGIYLPQTAAAEVAVAVVAGMTLLLPLIELSSNTNAGEENWTCVDVSMQNVVCRHTTKKKGAFFSL